MDGIGCGYQAACTVRKWLVGGLDGVVGIAPCFRPEGPRIESPIGVRFSAPV